MTSRSILARLVLTATIAALMLAAAPPALAVYGDDFGLADAPNATYPGPVALYAGTCDLASTEAEVGTAPDAPAQRRDCIDYGTPNSDGRQANVWSTPPAWRLRAVTQAGAHPDASTAFWFKRSTDPTIVGSGALNSPEGAVRDTSFDLPPGLVADPTAVPRCDPDGFAIDERCPPETQVGIATLRIMSFSLQTEIHPVYNMEPRRGKAAELMIARAGGVTPLPIVADVRTDGDFGVTALTPVIPNGLPSLGAQVTVWGVPWDPSHDLWRIKQTSVTGGGALGGLMMPEAGLAAGDQATYSPGWGPIKPFWSNPTECDGNSPMTALSIDSWQKPGQWLRYETPAPPVTGCDKLPFAPTAAFTTTSAAPDSASGIGVGVDVPANDEPPSNSATDPDSGTGAPAHWRSDAGLATSQLDKAVVTLPEGLSVNPSGAAGLEACSNDQIGVTSEGNPYVFNNDDPFDGAGAECPDGSKIGTATARSPVLPDDPLTGELVLGTPRSTDPQSGEMFRLFLVLRNEDRGLNAKIFGSAVADPVTGRLTATFDKNPRVPVERIQVDLKGGARGVLAMPSECGDKPGSATFTPWTAAWGAGGIAKTVTPSLTVGGDCSSPFAPSQTAGMSTQQAKANGTFAFRFSREDGSQYFRSLAAVLPEGLLASIRDVPLCTDAEASAGACPAASRVGSVDASAGSGTPFVLERKGDVYLTEGYKGGPFGLMVRVPVEAGPFRGDMALRDVVVRQAIHVDPTTARVTAVSDPFPEIWHGVPLRVRSVTVSVDRPGFMVNPTSCAVKAVGGFFESTKGTGGFVSSRFQAGGCDKLPLAPKLSLAMPRTSQTEDGDHPQLDAVLTQNPQESNLSRVQVALPLSLALDPDNAQALCEYQVGKAVKGGEVGCPKGSIVGRAKAITPLLKRPLYAPVYFVKNERVDPKTGRTIKTLPTLLIPLRGEINVDLRATSDVIRGKLVNTFENIPDAQISRFELSIDGGKNGILAVTLGQSICRGKQIATAEMDGQNGKQFDPDVRMATPCPKPKAARLRIGTPRWSGRKLTVAGKITAAATRRALRLSVRCGTTQTATTLKPRKGRWSWTGTLNRTCRTASKARLTARYAGDPTVKTQSAGITISRRRPGG